MAIGALYVTEEELKVRLGLTEDDDVDDPAITSAVNAASAAIESSCHRQFNKETTASARMFTADSPSLLLTDDFHEITGLVVATDEDGDGVYETTWDPGAYLLTPLNGIVNGRPGWPYWRIKPRGPHRFPCSEGAVQVTAQWGWAAVPEPVVNAAYILAEELARLKDLPFGVAGYGDYGRVRARENPNVALLLGPYLRDVVQVA